MPATPPDAPSPILGIAYTLLGIGFFLSGVSQLKGYSKSKKAYDLLNSTGEGATAGLGRGPLQAPKAFDESVGGALKRALGLPAAKATMHTVRTIEQRLSHIQALCKKGGADPKIRDIALSVLGRKCGDEWCVPERAWRAEAAALYKAITDPKSDHAVRYTRDPEHIDVFTAASRTLQIRGGDCDDSCILLASLLIATGQKVRLCVMQAAAPDVKDWSHIFLACLPPGSGSDGLNAGSLESSGWYFLDPTMRANGPGWEPPGFSVTLKTGRPAGITVKAKVFKV